MFVPHPIVIKGAAIGREPHNGPQYGETLDDGTCYTLNTIDRHAVAFDTTQITSPANRSNPKPGDPCQVRRLTPRECERLQGFPDDFTAIPWRGKPAELCPDGPRYQALGNSMAVPVISWLGKRIQQVDKAK